MSILEKIQTNLIIALKAKDPVTVLTLRSLVAVLKDERIKLFGAVQKQLTDEQIMAVLRREVKKRREAIELYQRGKRPELAEKERNQIKIIEQHLPAQMGKEQLAKITQRVIAQTGASGPGDFGKVMGQVMVQVKGQIDGSQVAVVVKKALGA